MKVPIRVEHTLGKRCINFIFGLALAVLLPAQVSAQLLTCNGAIEGSSPDPGPFFEGDNIRIDFQIGATIIDGGTAINIPEFSYFLDCGPGDAWPNCTDEPLNDIEYVGNLTTDCTNEGGDATVWDAVPNGGVLFTATNGPAFVLADSKCLVSFDIRVNTVGVDPKIVNQVFGFDTAICDNDRPGGAQGSVAGLISTCSIDVVKEVSADGGANWFDANLPVGPSVDFPPGDALYRLIVSNTGDADFVQDIVINDAALGIMDATIPPLPAGDSTIVGQGDIPELNAIGRCTQEGAIENVSDATGICRIQNQVDASDNDNAWLNCVPPPEIDILKEISVDGGANWYDANVPADYPPEVAFPAGALYRITVSNPGTVDLVNVTVDDPTLGIAGYSVGDLAAGSSVLLDSGDIPQLDAAVRCDAVGTYTNVAFANGESALSGTAAPEAQDPASMVCIDPNAEFRVIKTFSDGSTDEVDVLLTCNTGLPLEQSFTIRGGDPVGVTFIVTSFLPGTMTCEVTETAGPEGYIPIYNDGDGCRWENIVPDLYVCEISNIADVATFSVFKEWIVVNDGGEEVIEQAAVTIWCSSEIIGGFYDDFRDEWFKSGLLGDGDVLTAMVDTTQGPTTCYATESISQSGVESEDNCDSRPIPAGGSSSCTFVNTVYFEGIPTLGQYGLAVLALLMLGVGLVGFRRMA